MFYKWQREDSSGDLLRSDETVLDFTFISERNFILIILLTSDGDLRIEYGVHGGTPKHKVVAIKDLAPDCANAAATLCLVPDASCVALILISGNVLLIPIKMLLDVPWGCEGIIADNTLALIEVETNESDCFRTPTSALCYNALYSKRPFLIYSNKAGQIFIIDLSSRKLSVGLGAPQSVHVIETFITSNSVHLLVTGFTGAQWIVPLESEGRSLRETLGDVIPSELEQLHKTSARLSTTQDGKLCLLCIDQHKVQLFDDISMKQSSSEVNVPENTWLVHMAENTIFAICQQTTVKTAVHFGMISSFAEASFDELETPFPEERILGIIPIASSQFLPSCIVISEKGAVRLLPARTFDEAIVEFVARRHFAIEICDYLATRFNHDRLKLCTKVVQHSLRNIKEQNNDSEIEAITKLALDAQVEMRAAIRIFAEFDAADALLPAMLSRCSMNACDESRHAVVELYVAKLKRLPSAKESIENDLRAFLLEYTDVDEGVESLLDNGLWSCVAVIVPRSAHNSEVTAKFLTESKADWPAERASHIVRILAGICWSTLPHNAEELLARMAYFLPHLQSTSHIATFAKIAEEQMNRFHQAGATLYALCSLRLLSATPSFNYASLPSNLSLSCGSNCTAVISEDESVMFIGEFSAGSMKMKEAEKSKGTSASRVALPQAVQVPERVCSVSCGTEHLLCLTIYGKLYSFGRNRFGECGVGHKREVNEACRIRGPFDGVRVVRAGHYHSALIDSNGRVFTWGWALHGQLGHDSRDHFEDVTVPRLVESLQDPIVAVSCGYAHTIFLSEAGKVYACGNGGYGQLGCGEEVKKRYRPELVEIAERVKLISSKYFHCLAVTESHKIFQWGTSPQTLKMKIFLAKRVRAANKEQQQQSSSSPSASTTPTDKSPEQLEMSQTHLSVVQVEHMISDEIIQIDAGYSHSAIVTKTGLIYTWGKGLEMQLGHGNKKEQEEPHQLFEPSAIVWRHVSCGFDFTAAVANDGSVFVWGRNDKNQLGVQSALSPQVTRKLIIKGPKGPRSIQIAADSPCIAVPTRLPSVTAFVRSEVSSDQINDANFIHFLQSLDQVTVADISSHLLQNAIISPAAIFVHLLAGELQNAVDLLVQLPIAEHEIAALINDEISPRSSGTDLTNADASGPSSLLATVWELVLKHPNFCVQWTAISTLLSNYPIGDLLLRDRKLSAQAPMILSANPEMLAGLSGLQKLRLLEKWQPEAPLYPMQIAQNDLQNVGSRVRYWSCCGSVEKCGSSRTSVIAEKRRICSKCSDAWTSSVKSKFSKYEA
uniref:RCC1-like domain-containing protein n=2 Tax=Parascaris univalens TaxID=6257 RepID=A0A915ATI5_PARUN